MMDNENMLMMAVAAMCFIVGYNISSLGLLVLPIYIIIVMLSLIIRQRL